MSGINFFAMWDTLKTRCLALKSVANEAIRENLFADVDDALWSVFEPTNPQAIKNDVINWKIIRNCQEILAGGESFEAFSQEVRQFDDAPTCGLVWTPNFFAYRCRTCGLTPAMSLCSECFLAGDHEGHDCNMFQSQAGGACDCGDAGVMQESGFCPKHATAKSAKKIPPDDLLCIAEYVLPQIYRRLLIHFREYGTLEAFVETGKFIDFLQTLSDLGAAMRNIMSASMMDKEIYQRLMQGPSHSNERSAFLSQSQILYDQTVQAMENIATEDDADALECPELCAPLEHRCFVDEFMFWLVKFEFPQKLVTLLLSLLSSSDFRVSFAEAFVKHYSRTAALLSKQQANDMVSNRVIHMSVQLMSSERLSLRLNKDQKLLRILVVSLHNVIKKSLTECTLHTMVHNFHRVVDLSSPILENHNYWAMASDLHNVLGNKALARAFLRDPALVDLWCNFIAFFQGMNVNSRQLDTHLEYESRAYYPAFTAEIEVCSTILWNLVHQLKDETLYDCILYTAQYVLGQIQEWFDNIRFVSNSCWKPPPLSMSFHLPLHRLYSAFVCQGIKMGIQVLFPSETFLRQLVMHPLQIQVVRSEVATGMWVRNGQSMRYQSCLYVQSHFCASFLDLDLYLLQVCGTRLHPDWFILTIFDRFHLIELLSFAPAYPLKRFLRADWEMPMLEGALRLIATIVCKTTHLGISEDDAARLELATLLATGNKTHSQILEQFPENVGLPGQSQKLVEKILPELATYQPPQFEPGGAMRQGTYAPKDVVWQKYFDPLFVMARSMQMKEYQDAFTRYTDYVRKAGLYKNKDSPWPPMPLPRFAMPVYDNLRRILHCRSLHAIIYVILYKTMANLCPMNEHVLYLVIYLLELAVQLPAPGAAVTEAATKRHTVLNLQFCGWFSGNCIFTNLCHRVDRILHIDNMPGLSRSCQDGSDTDADFPDLVRLRAKLSGSNFATTPDNQLVPSQVPRSRSGDIPFIDSMETDLDIETDYFYNKAMSYLPSALRRQYLANSPERLALTLDQETMAFVEEISDELAVVAASAENSLVPCSYDGPSAAVDSGSPLAIEFSPNDERSLVLKPLGIISKIDDVDAASGQGSQSMLPEPEGMPGLPPSAPPPQALPHPKLHVTNTGESLLSLLVKLHDKLAGTGQLFQPSESGSQLRGDFHCAGDGPFYIRNLLDRIYSLSPSCRQEIDAMCASSTSGKRAGSLAEEEAVQAKKKAAKERQQRLMAQFTSRQKAVMDQLIQQELGTAEEFDESSRDEEIEPDRMVECVICNQSSAISLDQPIGLVAFASATSVFGKSYPEGEPFVSSVLDVTPNHKTISRGQQEIDYYRQLISSAFNMPSCISSTSMGWEGGVCVSTCGHHIHFDCHDAYIKSIKTDLVARPQPLSVLAVEKGEFYCPLCRQLANCVLPLVPVNSHSDQIPRRISERRGSVPWHAGDHNLDLGAVAVEIAKYFYPSPKNSLEGKNMKKATDRFILRLMGSTYPKFSELVTEMNAVWAFLCGVIRTNLEAEHIWSSNSVLQKRSCLSALLNLMPSRTPRLELDDFYQCYFDWTSLTGVEHDREENQHYLPLANVQSPVPLILKDAIAVLIRFSMLLIQKSSSTEHFAVMCQALFNLVVVQSIVNVLERFSINELPPAIVAKAGVGNLDVTSSNSWEVLASYILESCFMDDRGCGKASGSGNRQLDETEFYSMVESRCLPFLHAAATIKRHGISHSSSQAMGNWTFASLCEYVLGPVGGGGMRWINCPTRVLPKWIDELKFVKSKKSCQEVLARPLLWSRPRLIPLPKQFDVVFQRYHKATCLKCRTSPKELLICLICGDLVCFRDACCKSNSMTEVETHAVDCGAGTGVYLSVHASTILVSRDKRAGHWGSLYLDSHGEEDKGLKRGKPLYLSEERFALLENHWVSHSFDSVCKRWFPVSQSWVSNIIPL